MPIYEFKCKHCGNVFEYLQLKSDENNAPCPRCGKNDTDRLLSTFSSVSSSGKKGTQTLSSASCRPSSGFS